MPGGPAGGGSVEKTVAGGTARLEVFAFKAAVVRAKPGLSGGQGGPRRRAVPGLGRNLVGYASMKTGSGEVNRHRPTFLIRVSV